MFDQKNRVIVLATPLTQKDRLDWCCDHLAGAVMSRPIIYGDDHAELWYFATAEEATMFSLRWGGTNGYY